MLLLLFEINKEFRGCDPFTLGFLDSKLRIEPEARQRALQLAPICARIQKSADSHIATDAGKRVEIADFHWFKCELGGIAVLL